MTFPTDYSGEIRWVDGDKDKNLFLSLMPVELRNLGLRNVFVQGDKILFGRGTGRIISLWNNLTALDHGEIKLLPNGDGLIVAYRLRFKLYFIVVAVLYFCLLMLWLVLGHPLIQFAIWLGLFAATLGLLLLNCWMVTRKFGRLIRSLLASMRSTRPSQTHVRF